MTVLFSVGPTSSQRSLVGGFRSEIFNRLSAVGPSCSVELLSLRGKGGRGVRAGRGRGGGGLEGGGGGGGGEGEGGLKTAVVNNIG